MAISIEQVIEQIIKEDDRYPADAYRFLGMALVNIQYERERPSISGKELLEGLRTCALQQFGPETISVFEQWNIRNCSDIAHLVANLVRMGAMVVKKNDDLSELTQGYVFADVFPRVTLDATFARGLLSSFLHPDDLKNIDFERVACGLTEQITASRLSPAVLDVDPSLQQFIAFQDLIEILGDVWRETAYQQAIPPILEFLEIVKEWNPRPMVTLTAFLDHISPYCPELASALSTKFPAHTLPSFAVQLVSDDVDTPVQRIRQTGWGQPLEISDYIRVFINRIERAKVTVPYCASDEEVRTAVLGNEVVASILKGRTPRQIQIVQKEFGKIVHLNDHFIL
jgi:uncharacterized repeat protein (TIGR04138 family)